MPPKKAKGPKKLTEEQKQRNAFQRRKRDALDFCVASDDPQFSLFASRFERPDPQFKTKKTAKKKSAKTGSPNVSVEPVSSEDEDAGQFKILEKDENEEEREIRKLNQLNDSQEFPSMEVFNDDGLQCVWDGKGNYVEKKEQPEGEWRPAPCVETVGNFPMLNKPAKKNKVIDAMKKRNAEAFVPFLSKPVVNYQKSACATFQAANELHARERAEKRSTIRNFRIFDTPTKRFILTERRPQNQPISKDDRLSMFSYTPIRGKQVYDIENTENSITMFRPENASTPIEKMPSRKTRPVFNFSDEEEYAPETTKRPDQTIPEENQVSDTVSQSENICDVPNVNPESNMELVHDDESISTPINRKAETSVTELLEEAEEYPAYLEDSKYAKKRQRTSSPETMCQGATTVMTTQNEYAEMASTVIREEEEKEENAVKKRGTLQPQQRQLDRESRCPRLSALSVGSYDESINSAMSEMSLDARLQETMGDELGRTQFSESRAESRNAPTAMTIYNDDPTMVPFYLADATISTESTPMTQLLHVAGQKEIKTWNSLPESAFKSRTMKKLGEGSYGEVFATTWDKKKVAIKVVPFEADKFNRLYTGEYHSVQMQPADEILPELIVMKELNQLRDMNEDNSTSNFIELVSAEIVVGEYPDGMLKAWERYAKTIKESENTHMKVYSSEQQKSIVFVSGNGGIALEDFVLQSEQELFSILHQLIISMVVAEAVLEFEHRDLHLGNVLIDRNGVEELYYKYKGQQFAVKTFGLKVNIIDFTFSRVSKEKTTVFLDLENDPGIFEGSGNPQFDVYRQMRKECGGDWMKFNGRTNLMWIVFIANSLIDSPICPKGLLTVKRKKELRQIFTELAEFEACSLSLGNTEFFEKFYEGYFGSVISPENSDQEQSI